MEGWRRAKRPVMTRWGKQKVFEKYKNRYPFGPADSSGSRLVLTWFFHKPLYYIYYDVGVKRSS